MSKILTEAIRVIDIEKRALELLKENLNEDFENAVKMLSLTVANQKKIVVIGVGKSGNIGHKLAATLNSTGAPAVVLNAQNALHGDLGIVSNGDVVIALSYSGKTAELLDILPHLMKKDIKLIGITKKRDSQLGDAAHFVLETPIEKEACPLGLAPTSSSTAALVIGDALAMCLLVERGFTQEEFAQYHPSGALGKELLTRVKEIMRKGRELATCYDDATVLDAIKEMSGARSGACVIVNKANEIKGVFSHGDFARGYQNDSNIGAKQVAEYMTKSPITVHSEALAIHVIKMTSEARVDDVPVLDEDGKVVGIVDTQDFAGQNFV